MHFRERTIGFIDSNSCHTHGPSPFDIAIEIGFFFNMGIFPILFWGEKKERFADDPQ